MRYDPRVPAQLRLANPDDAALFVALVREGFAGTRGYPNPSSALDETEVQVRAALERDFGIVARLHGDDVGSARFRLEWARPPSFDEHEAVRAAAAGHAVTGSPGGRLFFSRLTVLPRARRRGVAHDMIRYLSILSLRCGIDTLAITVRSQQPDNRPLWQHLGFEITGYSERYGIDDMVTHMQRKL